MPHVSSAIISLNMIAFILHNVTLYLSPNDGSVVQPDARHHSVTPIILALYALRTIDEVTVFQTR